MLIILRTRTFKTLVLLVGTTFFIWQFNNNAMSVEFLKRGAADSETAAKCIVLTKGQEKTFYSYPDIKVSTPPDSLQEEFPGEEEGKHLARDITIFVVVSAFVGYFIVKVFLEGDKEETSTKEKGKPIP